MIITVDFETYYDKEFSLSKLTTEEYVRDECFEVIGVGVKVDDNETEWCADDIETFLKKFNWQENFVLAHNTMFDGAILSWRYGVNPKAWLDTLAMARAVDGAEAGNSLAKLAQRYEIGQKGTEVVLAMGKHRKDFTPDELHRYGEYCKNDVNITYDLFNIFKTHFKKEELKLIDLTLRMFTEPRLELNLPLLEQHLEEVKAQKEKLLASASADKDSLMSNQKFAELLMGLGVLPPTKISPTTGKKTFALAKNDEHFKKLAEHPDERVQALVAARLGTKSTLEETRTERLIGIAKRGSLPVPLRYFAAHTGRWGGDDKLNLQNLPRKSKLKNAIVPPKGYVLIDADSSQIEARILAWLAGEVGLVNAFERNEDVYRIMAGNIYYKNPNDVDQAERFVGKTTILGAGYGMGWMKFQLQLKAFGVTMDESACRFILRKYRETLVHIPALWEEANKCLEALSSDDLRTFTFGKQPQAVNVLPGVGFDLPNGLPLRYNNLRLQEAKLGLGNTTGTEYVYDTRKGTTKIYGGKVVENLCQALARCVIGEQMLRVAKRYKVVLTVHDAIACIAPIEEKDEAVAYVEQCMKWRPSWAKTLPLSCEVGHGESYGHC